MKFQKKYEDPRRIYLKVNETTESKEIMQKPYLVEFRMNDKEKIEAIKKIFDQSRMKRMSLAEEFGEEELTGMNDAIEKIVYSQRIRKILEK